MTPLKIFFFLSQDSRSTVNTGPGSVNLHFYFAGRRSSPDGEVSRLNVGGRTIKGAFCEKIIRPPNYLALLFDEVRFRHLSTMETSLSRLISITRRLSRERLSSWLGHDKLMAADIFFTERKCRRLTKTKPNIVG